MSRRFVYGAAAGLFLVAAPWAVGFLIIGSGLISLEVIGGIIGYFLFVFSTIRWLARIGESYSAPGDTVTIVPPSPGKHIESSPRRDSE